MTKRNERPLLPPTYTDMIFASDIPGNIPGGFDPRDFTDRKIEKMKHEYAIEGIKITEGIDYPTLEQRVAVAKFYADIWVEQGFSVPTYLSKFLEEE
ncbi:MAG: hypothetical protein WCG44_03025 [bacterium]